ASSPAPPPVRAAPADSCSAWTESTGRRNDVVVSAVQHAGLSDTGRQRDSNQDRWGADAEQCLFVVADGVSSSNNGELAAAVVVELLPTYLRRGLESGDDPGLPERLGQAIVDLSNDLCAYGGTDPRLAGSSTTVVAAVVTSSRAFV